MRVLFLGATSGMGKALAQLLAEKESADFVLLGRSLDKLEKAKIDIEARGGRVLSIDRLDLIELDSIPKVVDKVWSVINFDLAVITAALFAPQEKLEEDRELLQKLLIANFTGTILLCEEIKKRFLKNNRGTLCVFSSVAGDRGRSPVVLYGATKAGLSYYLEALDHRYRRSGLVVIDVKPGFVKTSMTAGLPTPPFAGEPTEVAYDVYRAIKRKKPLVYTPRIWKYVMFIIRKLPRSVMRRVNF